jgi:hypothetical protein
MAEEQTWQKSRHGEEPTRKAAGFRISPLLSVQFPLMGADFGEADVNHEVIVRSTPKS